MLRVSGLPSAFLLVIALCTVVSSDYRLSIAAAVASSSAEVPWPTGSSCAATGGWRTMDEWKVMFKKAGFRLEKSEAVGASMHLMVWDQV